MEKDLKEQFKVQLSLLNEMARSVDELDLDCPRKRDELLSAKAAVRAAYFLVMGSPRNAAISLQASVGYVDNPRLQQQIDAAAAFYKTENDW